MKMIKGLQIKIILTVMCVVTLVLSVIFISINTLLSNFESRQSKLILETLAVNDGNKASFSISREFFFQPGKSQDLDSTSQNEADNNVNPPKGVPPPDSGFIFSLYNITRSMPYDIQ